MRMNTNIQTSDNGLVELEVGSKRRILLSVIDSDSEQAVVLLSWADGVAMISALNTLLEELR